jgi:glycosyltransferase involved in cell wall biosynthesis
MTRQHIIVFVKRQEHVDALSRIFGETAPTIHCVCLSLDAFISCSRLGYAFTIPSDYQEIQSRNFVDEGHALALEWVGKVSELLHDLPGDAVIHFATLFSYFFTIALYYRSILEVVVKEHQPSTVYIFSGSKNPIVTTSLSDTEDDAVMGSVAAQYLSELGIPYDYLPPHESDGPHEPCHESLHRGSSSWFGMLDRLRGTREQGDRGYAFPPMFSIPADIFESAIHVVRSLGITPELFRSLWRRFKMSSRLAASRCRSVLTKEPVIVFWGSKVDALYQFRLFQNWRGRYRWIMLRFERRYAKSALPALGKDDHFFGLNMNDALSLFGRPPSPAPVMDEQCRAVQNELESWTARVHADLLPVYANRELSYQYRKMLGMMISFRHDINNLVSVLHKVNPSLVITHHIEIMALAARAARVPSLVINHGGIQSAYYSHFLGDINIAAGEIQKRHFEELNKYCGSIVVGGSPHITIRKPTARNDSPDTSSSRKRRLTLLATGEPLNWTHLDYRIYTESCERLSAIVTADDLLLVVKFHPRSGANTMRFHDTLFSGSGYRVSMNNSPDLQGVLQDTDVLIATELSTAVLEAMISSIPVILLFLHYPPYFPRVSAYYRDMKREMIVPDTIESFEAELHALLSSPEYRSRAVRRQDHLLPVLLDCYGDEASEKCARIIQDMLNGRG